MAESSTVPEDAGEWLCSPVTRPWILPVDAVASVGVCASAGKRAKASRPAAAGNPSQNARVRFIFFSLGAARTKQPAGSIKSYFSVAHKTDAYSVSPVGGSFEPRANVHNRQHQR